MKNKVIGMNHHYRFYKLETFFKKMHFLNIKNIELWTGPMHFLINNKEMENPEKLIKLMEKYEINIVGICPEQTNPKPYNIASLDFRKNIIDYYRNIIELAERVGASQVLVTSGWGYLDEPFKDAWNRSIEMMKTISKMAQEKELILSLEALQPEESKLVNTITDLRNYVDEVNEGNLKICIDMGAMARSNETLSDYFEAFNHDIQHIHFVDGNPTGHLAWGDGARDLKEDLLTLKKYKYNHYLSLETANERYHEKPWDADITTLNYMKEMERIL